MGACLVTSDERRRPALLLDVSPGRLRQLSRRLAAAPLWQLCTPLTAYARADGVPYGLDNGCYRVFRRAAWERLLERARVDRPIFVALPDVVGDARATAVLFDQFHALTEGLPRALVLQDGIRGVPVPWEELVAVFVGGTDGFKASREVFEVVTEARARGLWVHVGRVNTPSRLRGWFGFADSLDGSGISRFDWMLEQLLAECWMAERQGRL